MLNQKIFLSEKFFYSLYANKEYSCPFIQIVLDIYLMIAYGGGPKMMILILVRVVSYPIDSDRLKKKI